MLTFCLVKLLVSLLLGDPVASSIDDEAADEPRSEVTSSLSFFLLFSSMSLRSRTSFRSSSMTAAGLLELDLLASLWCPLVQLLVLLPSSLLPQLVLLTASLCLFLSSYYQMHKIVALVTFEWYCFLCCLR